LANASNLKLLPQPGKNLAAMVVRNLAENWNCSAIRALNLNNKTNVKQPSDEQKSCQQLSNSASWRIAQKDGWTWMTQFKVFALIFGAFFPMTLAPLSRKITMCLGT